MKRLDLVVGSNGAGKSTFIRLTLAPSLPARPFVNADLIAAARWPEDAAAHSYEAARIAADTREAMIEQGTSFIAETVFSHPSKLDLIRRAQRADFSVVLHVVMVPEELTVSRVRLRVAAGGHTVPEEKIRARYPRVWTHAAAAIRLADITNVWDNCSGAGPRRVALFRQGVAIGAPSWPGWTPRGLVL